ncbi:MAG: hypothetical protein AB7F37_14595 [Variibacter sp.]
MQKMSGHANQWLCVFTATCLALPIALPPVFRYETTPAFLLAPLVAWSVVVLFGETATRAFVLAGICGLASIFISASIKPDGRLQLDLLSLLLLMFAAGFYFLGRYVGSIKRLVTYFVVFSAAFLVPATLRNVLGEPVQSVIPDATRYTSFAILNVEWFGWRMFGYFGILGAAHMVCLQAALAIGVALATNYRWLTIVSAAVFACAAYLIVGSQSRGALVALLMILGGAGFYVVTAERKLWRRASAMIAVAIVAGSFAQFQSLEENRFVQTVRDVAAVLEHEPASAAPPAPSAPPTAIEPAPATVASNDAAPSSAPASEPAQEQPPGPCAPAAAPPPPHA